MSRLPFHGALLALFMALFLFRDASSDKKKDMPNILVIMTDDQDLLLNSMDFMPNVKSLIGENGTTFTKHYCTSAFCCPSRVSLYSGRCVHNTNVTSVTGSAGGFPKFVAQGINDDYLPLWLQQGGVNTYYVGKFSNGHNITNYVETPIKGWTSGNYLLEPGQYDYTNSTWALDTEDWKSFTGDNVIDVTTKHSLDMIDKAAEAGKPWFMTIAPSVPHAGINASDGTTYFPIPQDKWKSSFGDAKVPRNPDWNPSEVKMGASWILELPEQNQTTIDLEDELYRARVRVLAGIDDMVAELIASLEKHDMLDNTYIVYTTDNGYHIGNHRLGPGKKQGYETDVNIPMIWRGPGVDSDKTTDSVSTHTDLAPTFLTLFGLPLRTNLDGRTIPEITGGSKKSGEHVNIELWGAADPYEIGLFKKPGLPSHLKNTYKGLRIIADDYSLYYSVWCTNEHELYDMTEDPWQTTNLIPNTMAVANITSSGNDDGKAFDGKSGNSNLRGRPLSEVVNRIDALLMVLKTCVTTACTEPWKQLHPDGNVDTLHDAMDDKYDDFYAMQPKVYFDGCRALYIPEVEGPMSALAYSAGAMMRVNWGVVGVVACVSLWFGAGIW